MRVITTHDNADFDGVAAMLAAHRLYPDAVPVLPRRLARNVRQFIALFQNGLPFVHWKAFKVSTIDAVILVDTQKLPEMRQKRHDAPVQIIDHHPQESQFDANTSFFGEIVGAATTLLVERLRQRGDVQLTSLEATLLALGIYSDTGSLTYGTTTARDALAAAWLIEQGAVVDRIRTYMSPPLNEVQRDLLNLLMAALETRTIQGHTIAVATARVERYVENINSVAHRLRDLIDPTALFVLVEMHTHSNRIVQIVARSREDAVDVGSITRSFGGGGHSRAAAAHVSDQALSAVVETLWHRLSEQVQPVASVSDLMSFGVQTVAAEARLHDIIVGLRRIGHEGFPVLHDERVVGLLTRRDADRALTHGLKDATVRDVMVAGSVTLKPTDSVATLERVMVQSDWGQIPVIDDQQRLIGIVTRTDLIKHWANVHPPNENIQTPITETLIARVLGPAVLGLIESVGRFAQGDDLSAYVVGGVVRDLLLERPNDDIDFVIEGDAITFAQGMARLYGGKVSGYPPFGTATWFVDQSVADALKLDGSGLPTSVDFATARNEFYEHPTALPSVYHGSIKLDLHRRDFTINTLAIQVSPAQHRLRLLDFYGGLDDLRARRIRVLHSLSFVDDPTRVLRAIRFEHRLGFEIEARTRELIESAHPMLRRITGERLRNELKLLLQEPTPERALLAMQQRGVLSGIHPDFTFTPEAAADFQRARETRHRWPMEPDRERHLYWMLIMARVPPERLPDLGARLLFRQSFIQAFVDAATLCREPGPLADPHARPSQIVARLDGLKDLALLCAWVSCASLQHERIARYIAEWQHLRPSVDGNTLKGMGLKPGPHFKVILTALRDAWLDGEVYDAESERAVLERLIDQTLE